MPFVDIFPRIYTANNRIFAIQQSNQLNDQFKLEIEKLDQIIIEINTILSLFDIYLTFTKKKPKLR